ncbi:MAG TPA: hypothetical protein VH596_01740 [Terriglobales bacterium]|jgi:hypothetical protein
MTREIFPTRNAAAAHRRKSVAARRVGLGAACACGEKRPEALIPNVNPPICAACQRTALGKSAVDKHHFASKANNATTIHVPVNDHRAELSTAQADWPQSTLRNIEGSPLLAAAGCVRGFVDTILYLIERGLLWIAELLENLDEFLMKQLGPGWWIGTEVEQFAPKRKPHAKS